MSYTLNYRGAKIDELLGQVDEQFIAEYNVSLYADITAAIAAGKQVLLKKDNALYPYIGQDATSAYTFAMVDEDAILQLFTVSTASVWATVSKQLQEELTFDAAPTDGSTNPVTSDGIYDAIEEAKSEIATSDQPGMTVGASDNLISDAKISNSSPYLYRPVLSGVGNRAWQKLVGATIANNQLVNTGATSVNVPSGHKYYSKINGVSTLATSDGSAISINDSSVDEVHDLTATFGSTIADYAYTLETQTAGSGIAWLKSYGFFGKYAPYDAGSLISTKAEKKKVVGKNLFNPATATEGKGLDNNGVPYNSTVCAISDFIRISPNEALYCKNVVGSSYGNSICFYDGDNNFLSKIAIYGGGTRFVEGSVPANSIPSNAVYARIATDISNYETSTMLSFGSTATAYEPYTSQEYNLGSDELRGLFKLDANNNIYADGDIKTPDGQITRKYGIVDLGTLDYNYNSNYGFQSADALTNIKPTATVDDVANAICSARQNGSFSTLYSAGTSGGYIAVLSSGKVSINSSLTDPAAFKAAMSGVYLVYELATPTTEQGTPFIDPSIVYPNGTEEYIDTRTVPVPVGNDTEYTEDLKGGLETILDTPPANGTYVLKATVSGGVATLSWVSE